MQVIINIPDNMDLRNYDINYDILNIITSGVQLPKGHGRLIDVSEYFKKEFGDAREFLDKATTIIEADKESEGEE
jgi:hypothetical protein